MDELTKFTLTVRRNYRRVPYHNWTHAFSVAHCMFMILRKASSNFMLTEVGNGSYSVLYVLDCIFEACFIVCKHSVYIDAQIALTLKD